jgi:hypothetical protein
MPKGNIGLSLRRAPRTVPAGHFVPNSGNRRANLKKGDEVIHRFTGETGTVVECFVLTVAVRTRGITEPSRIVSGRYDEWTVKGHVYADHGPYAPDRSRLPNGYGPSGLDLAEASKS